MNVQERFLHYVSFDTQSDEHSQTTPSSLKQLKLAEALVDEMKAIGIQDAYVDEFGIVYGTIPANTKKDVKAIGFIAHMDTSPDMSGKNVNPRIIPAYDGSDIVLNEELGISMGVQDFDCLKHKIGDDLIVTDGTTLLGADDKAGIAEIMTMAEALLREDREHGKICIAFTPDEEVGRGTDHFRIPAFGADFAYTVDGGEVDCVDYENFNAASAQIQIQGLSIHPGSAKDKMINALLVAMEFHSMLPVEKNPAYTQGYEGFNHLTELHGECEHAYMSYIIRNHNEDLFEKQKEDFRRIADYLNQKYPEHTIQLTIQDSYANMQTIIEKDMSIIELVKTSMKQLGLQPKSTAIRGGTDGARLTYDGLPCPNLGTGGYNYHGKFEFASIQEMQTSVELLLKIVENSLK
ncbi:peptidase T [Erysipelotrichaceae bacterium AF15-26LB]|nr:peptidase T [Erysipelotrichaceae bacterium 3_1_53]MCR0348992.1 peptidase T [[Clostridium] innocuum]RJV90813.1 peptidase T [Erysipelotrichaceae bacterium AF15-26LB]RJV93499.1 peptidase T [Erysipelotrichaceae bacterium AF19-24AC]